MSQTEDTRRIERNKRIKQKKRKRMLKALVFFLCVALAVLGVLCLTVFFPVETIAVKGESPYSAEEIIAASGIDIGDNVIMAGRGKAKERIQKMLPYIKSVSLERNLDGSLVLNVKKAEERYCFRDENIHYITDADLKVLKTTKESDDKLVLVLTYGGMSGIAGESALFKDETDYTLFSLIEEKSKQFDLNVSVIDISKSYNMTLLLDSRFIVELGNNANIDEKISHYKTMLTKIKSGKTGFIELSSWNVSNEEAYFREKDISGYFEKTEITPTEIEENQENSSSESS